MSLILVVDDVDAVRAGTAHVLQRAGHEVIEAASGEEALALAHERRPSLVLMDVQMPGMGGIEAIRRLRADPSLQGLAIVGLSAAVVDPESQALGMDAGADAYIARPVGNRELLARVNALLRQHEAAEKLRRSQANLHAVIQNSLDGLLVVEAAQQTIVFANPAAGRLMGRTQEALLGSTFGNVLVDGDVAEIDLVIAPGQDPVTAEIRCTPIDWSGPAWLVCLHDVTALRRALARSLEREQRFRALFEQHPDAAYALDVVGRLTSVNPACERLTGLSSDTLLRGGLGPLAALDADGRHVEGIAQALAGRAARYDATGVDAVGHRFEIEVTAAPVQSGGALIAVYVINRDVTLERAAARRARESDELRRLAARIAHFGGWSLDLRSGVLSWSEEVARIHEVPPGWTPDLDNAIRFYAEPCRQRITDAVNACIEHGQPWDLELQIVTARGRQVWVRAVGQAERDAAGQTLRLHGAFQDIDELKRQQLALERLGRLHALQSAVNEAIVAESESPEPLLERVCRAAVEHGGFAFAWVARLTPDGRTLPLCHAGDDQGYLALTAQRLADPAFTDWPAARLIEAGRYFSAEEVKADPQSAGWAQDLAQRGWRAVAVVPLHCGDRRDLGLLLAGSELGLNGDARDRLLVRCGENLSHALEAIEAGTRKRETEARLKLLQASVERLNDMILITEAEPLAEPGPRLVYVNPAFERVTGWRADEVIGRTPRLLQGPDTQREVLDRVAAGLRAWQPVHEELINYRKDGSAFWLEMDIVPVADAHGRYTHWVAIERDVSERKAAEVLLRQREADLRRAQQAGGVGFWIVDPADGRLQLSDETRDVLGLDLDAGADPGAALQARVHPDDRTAVQAALHGGAAPASLEFRLLRPDGHPSWLYLRGETEAAPAHGGAARRIGSVVDITARKLGEQRLLAQLERLHLLHRVTRAIGHQLDLARVLQGVADQVEAHLPAALCAVLLRDESGGAVRLAGCGSAGRPLARQAGLDGDALPPDMQASLAGCLAGHVLYEPSLSASLAPLARSLSLAGLGSVILAPLQMTDEVIGVLLVARVADLSFNSADTEFVRQVADHAALAARQARLHGSLRQAYESLARSQAAVLQHERLVAVGSMASGLAHDINNALSPAVLYVDALLAGESGLGERARAQLATVQQAIEDVATTVTRLREFSRPRSPGEARSRVDLGRVARQVLDLTRARWHDMALQQGAAIQAELQLDTQVGEVLGAENELREALTNLVFNAVDAMPQGGRLTLRTRVGADGGAVVEVVDTGHGMDEATRERCIEPFFTTKGERGTGLGLGMVFGAAERHGARLSIDSAPGQGTTVGLHFAPAGAPARAAPAPAAPLAPARAATPLRLLVVDDDEFVLRSVCAALEREGHSLHTAAGGREGIEQARAAAAAGQPFDAVITDLGMPGVDGREVAREVKALGAATRVLLLTGWGRGMIQEGECPPHVDRVLAKPPRLAELREALAGSGVLP